MEWRGDTLFSRAESEIPVWGKRNGETAVIRRKWGVRALSGSERNGESLDQIVHIGEPARRNIQRRTRNGPSVDGLKRRSREKKGLRRRKWSERGQKKAPWKKHTRVETGETRHSREDASRREHEAFERERRKGECKGRRLIGR